MTTHSVRLFSVVACTLGGILWGCSPSFPAPTEAFKDPDHGGIKRAAYELGCPQDQLEVTDLGSYTMGVSGCGKKAVYKQIPGAGWVNNSATEAATTKSEPAGK